MGNFNLALWGHMDNCSKMTSLYEYFFKFMSKAKHLCF